MQNAKTLRQAVRAAPDIAAELRREFETAFQARFGTQAVSRDPVLFTLFHSLAVQIGRIYDEAEQVFPAVVLDDLISALGMPHRLAQPAQAVVAFSGLDRRERIGPETELSGYTQTGENLGFTPDDSIELAPVTLAFAAVYELGRLHSLSGAEVAEGQALPPGNTPLKLEQAAPTLFLAFDADPGHLGGLGIFIDTVPLGGPVIQAVRRSPWQVLNNDGLVTESGVLRARPGRGGLQRLDWFTGGDAQTESTSDSFARALELGEGPYGGHVWIFPPVPPERRFRCGIPPALTSAVPRLLPKDHEHALDRPLVWVQVPLPAGTHGVASAIQGVNLNCVTASNIEVWSEQIFFDRVGSVVAVRPEGAVGRHAMAVLSVVGEGGSRYVEEADVGVPISFGRYAARGSRFGFRPARLPTGRFDAYAMLRILLCDGERANGMDLGSIRRIGSSLANVTAQVTNLTVTRGGAAPPEGKEARLRFAELLRTRERVVTSADIEITARAFEPRIVAVEVVSSSEISDGGLRPVETVRARVRRADFADPPVEIPRLADLLTRHLQARSMIGHQIQVIMDEQR